MLHHKSQHTFSFDPLIIRPLTRIQVPLENCVVIICTLVCAQVFFGGACHYILHCIDTHRKLCFDCCLLLYTCVYTGVILPAALNTSELSIVIRPRHEVGTRNTWFTRRTGPTFSTTGPRTTKLVSCANQRYVYTYCS